MMQEEQYHGKGLSFMFSYWVSPLLAQSLYVSIFHTVCTKLPASIVNFAAAYFTRIFLETWVW